MFFNASAASWRFEAPPTNAEVQNFHRRLPDYSITPLVPLQNLARELGLGHVLVKDESDRFGLPAFKILGASWATYKAVAAKCGLPLTCSLEELGAAARHHSIQLFTCTEGNWGRAVARMAKYLQIPSVIFVPKFMDRATQDKISSEGAQVVVVEGDYDKSIESARREAECDNSLLVMDVSWEGYEQIPQWVVEGYSTMLLETDQQLQELGIGPVTHAIASVGVGSWAQAVVMHYKSKNPTSSVTAVEPDTAACLKTSLKAGEIKSITTGHTIMNGMNCGTVSHTAWQILKQGVDASIDVSDLEAHQDLEYLHSQGLKNGPCGAATLSALRRLVEEKKLGLNEHSVVVLFNTEGARDAHVSTCSELTSNIDQIVTRVPATITLCLNDPYDQMHRPKSLAAGEQGTPSATPTRLHGKPASADRLHRPFKCPGSATSTRISDKPARKRRKINYAGADGENEESDKPYSNDDRLALATRDVNRFPVFKPKDKDSTFKARFVVPLKNKDTGEYNSFRPAPLLGMRLGRVFVARPLHDPSGEFAIVLYDPTIDDKPMAKEEMEPKLSQEEKKTLDEPLVHKSLADILGLKKKVDNDRPRVPVVIDPRLTKVLRPHQVEGVKFLYRATTGLIDPKANGCIMADEMGLGKTLQCITLMYTLLKQSPDAGKTTIQKCVIACPSSLVRNWANELVKWLGKDAINPFAIDGKASKEELVQQIRQWCIASGRSVVRPVLIVSYETLRLNVGELANTPIGLLLCDEGHRLKNGESQTFTALNGLNVQKRVILSGTPIQNDLSEYFALLNFANPNYLGTRNEFRKQFEIPILRGRDADGTEEDRKKGDERLAELLALVNKFIIRRTNDILSKYLPVKYEHVVFCNLSPFQKDLYNHFIQSPDIKSLLRGKGSQPLKAIGMLKKLCNHPDLLDLPLDLPGSENILPEDFVPKEARGRDRDVKVWYSGKMSVLDRMLASIRANTNDKIVLISNYTQTLDVFAALCRARGYGCLRLDGTMNVSKRQKLVDKFNDPEGAEFVFLLSSKAGGCGLNLIGANRLVLFDPDWNPAADQQALARVWRDGQKKDCFVYRFIATGTIEEKIFQRQSHKQSLSSCVVDASEDVERHFSLDSLRELFQYRDNTTSDTHDTFKCKRCRKEDGRQTIKAPAMLYGDTNTWNHMVNDGESGPLGKIQDLLLRQETQEKEVSAVFQYISH